jgi:hypothetical protein
MIAGMLLGLGIFIFGYLCGHYRGYVVAKNIFGRKIP